MIYGVDFDEYCETEEEAEQREEDEGVEADRRHDEIKDRKMEGLDDD